MACARAWCVCVGGLIIRNAHVLNSCNTACWVLPVQFIAAGDGGGGTQDESGGGGPFGGAGIHGMFSTSTVFAASTSAQSAEHGAEIESRERERERNVVSDD